MKSRSARAISFVVLAGACRSGSAAPLPADVRGDRLVVEKAAHRMTLYRSDSVLKVYRVALGRGGSGDKVREGDNRVPEGRFQIDHRVEASRYHRALHVSYPDRAHAERAQALGVPPGGDIMVHGIRNGFGWIGPLHRLKDWTRGCVAVTNPEIEELWRAVPNGTAVEIRP
jgi:murein L,D-transpeptidase YafK